MARKFLPALRGGGSDRYRGELVKTIEGIVPDFRTQEQKAIFTSYADRLYTQGRQYGTRDWSIDRAVETAFTRVVWVFKSVQTISSDSSSLPVLELDSKDREVEDSPLALLLSDHALANPLETGAQLRKRISAQVLLSPKGVFVEAVRTNGGRIARYDLLPTSRCEIIPVDPDDEDASRLVKHLEVKRAHGGGVYTIPWEDVLWFRDPHPTDPFMGITPLEAAGMSVELDYFARLYNVSFMRNDGRPGGIVAVKGTGERGGDVDPNTLASIEAMFAKGPGNAGKLTAVTGEVSYVDFASNPRDAQYGQTAERSKNEILAAFGTPETVMGYAADRTFANADAEERIYWTITQRGHNKIIETGFSQHAEDGNRIKLDTSGVEILQKVEAAKREEARAEVAAGLRSPFSYAELAGIEGIDSTPFTRALYLPTGKTPLAATDADAAALGMAPAEGTGGVPPEGAAPGQAPAGDEPPQTPADAVAALASGTGPAAPPQDPAAAVAALTEGKALPAQTRPRSARRRRFRVVRDDDGDQESARASEHPADITQALERDLAETLERIIDVAVDRGRGRLSGVKARRHTRHWVPEYATDSRVGTKALDTARAVDPDAVEEETESQTAEMIAAAAAAAAVVMLADASVPDRPQVGRAVAGAAAAVTRWLAGVVAEVVLGMAAAVNLADQRDGRDLSGILEVLEEQREAVKVRMRRLAGDAAHTTVEAARDAVATVIAGPPAPEQPKVLVRRTWTSRRDEKVRRTHALADGQEVAPTVPFLVGGELLRFPRDPRAPLKETAGCRCWVRYLFLTETTEPGVSWPNIAVPQVDRRRA